MTIKKSSTVFAVTVAVICVAAMIAVNLIFRSDPPPDKPDTDDTPRAAVTTEPTVTTRAESADTSGTATETAETAAETDPPTEPESDTGESVTADAIYYPPGTEYTAPDGRDTDFSGCLFIGDSRTEGFMLYSGVTGASAYTARGLMVDTFFTSQTVNRNGQKLSVADALASDTAYSKIFVTLGINELGWVYDSVFRDSYARLIEYVRETCPSSELYLQTLIPVTASKSASDAIYNNDNIARYNDIIRALAAEYGVGLVDAAVLVCGDEPLPEDGAFDGIHLKKPYCQRWLDCIKSAVG